MTRDTLVDFFHDLSRAAGPFLVHDDGFRSRTFSYAEVARAARGFAARLDRTGLRKGDTVVFFSENRPEWVVAFWGCLLGGIVVVPVDYRASPEFAVRVARTVRARVALIGQDVASPWFEAPAAGPEPAADDTAPAVWKLQELDWSDGTPPAIPLTRDDVAEIIFTSGATAEPKGVVITHRNVLANIVPVEREVLKYRRWGRPFFPLRFLNLLPLSHMFGQAMATFIPPMLPGVVVFMRGYNPDAIVAQIKRRRISVLVSVPKILEVLRDHVIRIAPETATPGPKQHVARRWWRYRRVHRRFGLKFWSFVVGAAPLSTELEAFWSELGFAVIQGYGLTETAPIVSLNHPFGTKRGSVGKAIAGVEIRIAPDGEILVRGDNVTRGYFNAPGDTDQAFEDGWFHTGDVGELREDGQLFIRGRKKEMIVTPEGLNVFPEDVEGVLLAIPGVKEAAVVGAPAGGGSSEERVHAVLVADPGADIDQIVRRANAQLGDHQKIRRALAWPDGTLPRTEGTGKLKRAAIRQWVLEGSPQQRAGSDADPLTTLLARHSGREVLPADATIDELGLSSLERVELMVALENAFQTRIDEAAFAQARDVSELRRVIADAGASSGVSADPVEFPRWNRGWPARVARRLSLPTWILPLARVFAWIRVEGLAHVAALEEPVLFAANHQSHMDVPVILAAMPPKIRYRVAPAMAKEFFKAHFDPAQHGRRAYLTNSLNYYLAALFFNAFPLPQREAGARQTLQYIGELVESGMSVLLFPEGRRNGDIGTFRPGVGMIAARLGVAVVPVRIDGLDRVLHPSWKMARPGRVRVAFGAAMRFGADRDYEAIAGEVEAAVRAL